MAALIVVLVLLAGTALVWLLRRGRGGDRYSDVLAVGRGEAEERRAREGGVASLGGPSTLAGPAAAAKQFDDETRQRHE